MMQSLAAKMPGFKGAETLWNVAAAGLPFLVYLRTLAPTVFGLDSAELTTGAYVLGIVHAPGSPLYLLIGHAFTWLPFGDVGYRLNLLSACAAALTVFFVFRTLLDLTGRRLSALAASWFLAFTYYFWISAVAAELYALHVCFVSGLWWLFLRWREQNKAEQLFLGTFLFGLGLGNHLALILLAPGFAWLVLSAPAQIWRQPRQLSVAMICGALGTLVYLYLPWRYLANPPLNYAADYWRVNLATWDGFWWMVTGRMFSSLFFGVPLSALPTEALTFLHRLWSNFLGLGFIVGLIGLAGDFKHRPAMHIALLLMIAGHLGFYLTYGAADKELMFLPAYLIWGLWVGLGFAWLERKFRPRDAYVTSGVVLLLAFCGLTINFDYADVSQDWSARQWGNDIMENIPPHTVYLGTWGDVPILEYLQIVENQRSDVTIVNLVFVGPQEGIRRAREKLRAGLPVYTSSTWLSSDDIDLHADSACHCYRATLITQ